MLYNITYISLFFFRNYYSNYNCTFRTCQNDKGNCLDKLCFYNYSVVKTKSDNNNNNIFIFIYIYLN